MITFDTLIEKYPKNEALKQLIPFKSSIKVELFGPAIWDIYNDFTTVISWVQIKNAKEFKKFLKAFKLDDSINFQQLITNLYQKSTYDPDITPYVNSDIINIFYYNKLNFDLDEKNFLNIGFNVPFEWIFDSPTHMSSEIQKWYEQKLIQKAKDFTNECKALFGTIIPKEII